MNSYANVSSIKDINSFWYEGQTTQKENTIKQLINIFLTHDNTIPLFAEIYNQKWYMQWDFHKWDVLDHTKHVLKNFISLCDKFALKVPWLQKYMDSKIDEVSIQSLTNIALIYHDAGKKIMKETTWYMRWHAAYTIEHQWNDIAKRYQLTPKQSNFIASIITYHDIPPEKIDTDIATILQKLNAYPAFLLVTLSDIMATMWTAIKQEWIDARSEYVFNSLEKHFSS